MMALRDNFSIPNMNHHTENGDCLMAEIAEIRKQKFVSLVEKLAALRDAQYSNDMASAVIKDAEMVIALNLPSNLLQAAAIFVDFLYGFPPKKGSFGPPQWVTAKRLLPEVERGLLICTGLKDVCSLEENDVVVLIGDIPAHGLHAGMSGIVRELPSEDEREENYLVEFGEPEDSSTQKVQVQSSLFRMPRPGDFFDNYRD